MENQESMEKKSKERKKTISLQQLEANRRNARLSTGPKTIAGKRKVRWNALKHGLLAAEVVIAAGDGQESRRQFLLLLDQLRRDLQPQGTLEEMLVEKVAVCYWRMRRLLRYETGHIRQGLDTARSPKDPYTAADAIRELFGLEEETAEEETAAVEQLKPLAQQQEQLQDESYLARLSLPKKESLDIVLRYEASLERHLNRILRLLERLQMQRLWRHGKRSLNFAKQSHLRAIESTR